MTSAKDILAEGEGVFPADFCLRFHNGDDDMSFTPPLRRPAEGNCKYALGKAFGFGVTGGVNLLLDDEISESARSSIGAMPAPMVVDVDPGLPLLIIRARSVFGSSSPLPFRWPEFSTNHCSSLGTSQKGRCDHHMDRCLKSLRTCLHLLS